MRNLNVKLKDEEWESLAFEAEGVGASISNLVRIKLGFKPVTFSSRKTVLVADPVVTLDAEGPALDAERGKISFSQERPSRETSTKCPHPSHGRPGWKCRGCGEMA